MIRRQFSSGLRPAVLGLLLLLAGSLFCLSNPVFADSFYAYRDNSFRPYPSYRPAPVYRPYEERYEGHYRHHHRCRTHSVPYWDGYWGVWRQRVERVCW